MESNIVHGDRILIISEQTLNNAKTSLLKYMPSDNGINTWASIYSELFRFITWFSYSLYVSRLRISGNYSSKDKLFTVSYHKYEANGIRYTHISNVNVDEHLLMQRIQQHCMNIVANYTDVSFNDEREGSNPFPNGLQKLKPLRLKGRYKARCKNGKYYLSDIHGNPVGEMTMYDEIQSYRRISGVIFCIATLGNETFYLDANGKQINPNQQQIQENIVRNRRRTIRLSESQLRSIIRETIRRILLTA